MARFGRFQLGASIRNVTRPGFGDGDARRTLARQARAGVSATSRPAGFEAITVSADADVTRTATPLGDARRVASGAEVWLRGRRLGLRGGVSASTVGERRATFSTGVSVAPIKGLFIEAARVTGQDDTLTGWSSTLRFAF
jgi:hypothetical protein